MAEQSRDFDRQSYDLAIPSSQIAQYPSEARGESRLMVLHRKSGRITHSRFGRIADFLPRGTCLVANNSKVFPARLQGEKIRTGGGVEMLLTTPLPLVQEEPHAGNWLQASVTAILRPSKRVRPGERIRFGPDLEFRVLRKQDFGQVQGLLIWRGSLEQIVDRIGRMPLPPYIKRSEEAVDRDRYQTVYAREEKKGSAASPTAGLHFSRDTFDALRRKDIIWTEISLHVGYATFSPLRERDIRDHHMHSEYVEIPQESADEVNRARREGRPVAALGTTSTRALESAATGEGIVQSWKGWSDLYIYPGYRFKCVDHMITNFHLPDSTLILMVSAFAGREALLRAYKNAIQNGYRFFSYGDAMLIL
jgi:S-adenosylmethionine:tRNA ribosyltransferase-isomerase